jgi:flagellar assembly factor FliW
LKPLAMSSVAELDITKTLTVQLPLGLLGFERIKTYSLITKADQEPFCWLSVPHGDDLAFLVVPPNLVLPDYAPDLSDEDVDFLEIRHPNDALVLNIVTLKSDGSATVNLKGPIVINRHTMIGKQVVLSQSSYAIKHPIQPA